MSHKRGYFVWKSETNRLIPQTRISIPCRHDLMSWHSREAPALENAPTCECRLGRITGAVLHSTYDRNALWAVLFIHLRLSWPHQTLLYLWNGLVMYDLIRVSVHTHNARFKDNSGWIARCVCAGEVVRQVFTGDCRGGRGMHSEINFLTCICFCNITMNQRTTA